MYTKLVQGIGLGVAAACAAVALALLVGYGQGRGAELLYKSYEAPNIAVYLVDLDRGVTVRLRLPFPGANYVWSPDGEQIAFSANHDGDSDIFVMNASGRNIRAVTDNPAADYSPVWSPDGRQIAYISYASLNRAGTDIFIAPADGVGRPRNLTGQMGSSASPIWSPDGERLALLSSRGRRRTTYIADLNTGVIRPFNADFRMVFGLAWSPDGEQAAFVAMNDLFEADIYLSDARGGAARNLTNTTQWDDLPVWSPDGTQLAYLSSPRATQDLFVLDLATGESRNLTNTTANEHYPAWSPDGKRIAYTAGDYANAEVYIVEVASGHITRLTNNDVSDYAPMWRP